MKTVLGVLLVGLSLFLLQGPASAKEEKQACEYFTVGDDILPMKIVSPVYPRRAQERGIEGYAIVAFTVQQDGSVADVEIVEERPERAGFGKSAREAAYKYKYKPMTVDGKPAIAKCVPYTIIFEMPD